MRRVLRKLSLRTIPTKWQRENVPLDAQSPYFAVNLVPLYVDKGAEEAAGPLPSMNIPSGTVEPGGTNGPAAAPDVYWADLLASMKSKLEDPRVRAVVESARRSVEHSGGQEGGDVGSEAEAMLTEMSRMAGCGGDLQKLFEMLDKSPDVDVPPEMWNVLSRLKGTSTVS